MSKLSWVTPPGTLVNLGVGLPITYQLFAYDNANNGAAVIYSVISGTLPQGITLSSSGVISGTVSTAVASTSYTVVIRANSLNGYVVDGAFTIIVTNTITNGINWVTPSGTLGTVPSNEYYQIPIQAQTNIAGNITYSFISGTLPPGMQISTAGYLQGVPTFTTSAKVDQSYDYSFTVRAKVGNKVNDRSFNITVTDVNGPVIKPSSAGVDDLGTYFDGTLFTQQLTVSELNPAVVVTWSISSGALPTGVTLSNNGLLSGYIQPIGLTGAFGPGGYDGDSVTDGVVVQQQEFDSSPYDFNQLNQSLSYTFTVQAYDGANRESQTYRINVVGRSAYSADFAGNASVNDTYLTVDANTTYIPVLITPAGDLPMARQDSYYAFKFDGVDFSGDSVTYSLANDVGTFDAYVSGSDLGFDNIAFDSFNPSNQSGLTTLPGVVLDSQNGWLYGKVSPQSTASQLYTFGIVVSKVVDGVTYSSAPKIFSLTVLGDVNNIINWITPADLGSIDNGSVSELTIVAQSVAGKTLTYSLYDVPTYPARLPQGLTLLPSGDLSGRVSFEVFAIDDFDTTFDSDRLTFDRTCKFTVEVAATDGTISSTKEFTVAINVVDQRPYENLYLTAMPVSSQRDILHSIVNNTEIFNPNYIYRATDPWFGVQNSIRMLFLPGLNSVEYNTYVEAIVKNHWTKRYNFGSIGTAVVFDEKYNIKYEVVYVNIIDPEENNQGNGAPLEINLTNTIANAYIDQSGEEFKIIYPNNSANMITRLLNGVGYYDQSSLSNWMTSDQLSTTAATTFNPPLGYIKAAVLAYTLPGESKKIAYRLNQAGINFDNIDFSVDRYNLDNVYSQNFNTTANVFVSGPETTFDYLPVTQIGQIVGTVNYAISGTPFDQINGRPVDYINAQGGIDGVVNYVDGQTLIFAQQENFSNSGTNDGWVDYFDSYIGDNILTSTVEGYDSEGYDQYTVIPGYLENTQSTDIINGNNTISTYNISQYATDSSQLQVYVNNILQPTTNYIVYGSTLQFNTPPANVVVPAGNAQISVYSGPAVQTFTANGSQYTFTLANIVSTPTTVVVNGITQLSANYTLANVSGITSITFTTAPPLIQYPQLPPVIKVTSTNATKNQRGGIWRINIVNDIVNLEFVKEVVVGSRIQVVGGKTYAGSILTYTASLTLGHTVPYYVAFKIDPKQISSRVQTTFNAGTTRFFSNRDQYYAPGAQDQYLKFPQAGAFL